MRSIDSSTAIQGQLLRVSKHRAVAIYLRDGYTWVVDFVDGRGVLVDVDTWLRFNCGSPANPYALRRITLESAQPLPRELVAQIEDLHRLHESLRPSTRLHWMNAVVALPPRS
jgi:hypothetical protein